MKQLILHYRTMMVKANQELMEARRTENNIRQQLQAQQAVCKERTVRVHTIHEMLEAAEAELSRLEAEEASAANRQKRGEGERKPITARRLVIEFLGTHQEFTATDLINHVAAVYPNKKPDSTMAELSTQIRQGYAEKLADGNYRSKLVNRTPAEVESAANALADSPEEPDERPSEEMEEPSEAGQQNGRHPVAANFWGTAQRHPRTL